MLLTDMDTPAALVDEARLQRNIGHMATRLRGLGVRLRPHVKTTKCLPIVARQVAAGAAGLTVSTLKEAEAFFAAGHTDILYAVGIAPHRLATVRALRERGCALAIVVDSLAAAQAVVAASHAFEVFIEIDSDDHRAGLPPDSDALLPLARTLHDGGAVLRGVMTHAGASYACRGAEALAAMAEQERSRCVHAAQRLRAAGLPCPEVSVGSTPTALSARRLDGVTEVRAGVYAFHDLVMLGLGVCGIDDVALSVLTTVIGHQAEKGWVLVDAGWMAMSRDRGVPGTVPDMGYGQVCDLQGRPIAGLVMVDANQEHGILAWRDGHADTGLAQRHPVGSRLRVLPNHACATAAQFAQYHVVGGDGGVQAWDRFNGW